MQTFKIKLRFKCFHRPKRPIKLGPKSPTGNLTHEDGVSSIVMELLVAGVAFPGAGQRKRHAVYSHEGSYLGEIAQHIVDAAIHMMRRVYRVHYQRLSPGNGAGITYGYGEVNLPYEYVEQIMDKYHHSPVLIV